MAGDVAGGAGIELKKSYGSVPGHETPVIRFPSRPPLPQLIGLFVVEFGLRYCGGLVGGWIKEILSHRLRTQNLSNKISLAATLAAANLCVCCMIW